MRRKIREQTPNRQDFTTGDKNLRPDAASSVATLCQVQQVAPTPTSAPERKPAPPSRQPAGARPHSAGFGSMERRRLLPLALQSPLTDRAGLPAPLRARYTASDPHGGEHSPAPPGKAPSPAASPPARGYQSGPRPSTARGKARDRLQEATAAEREFPAAGGTKASGHGPAGRTFPGSRFPGPAARAGPGQGDGGCLTCSRGWKCAAGCGRR